MRKKILNETIYSVSLFFILLRNKFIFLLNCKEILIKLKENRFFLYENHEKFLKNNLFLISRSYW
jgi:hypothetical protein